MGFMFSAKFYRIQVYKFNTRLIAISIDKIRHRRKFFQATSRTWAPKELYV